MSRVPTDRTTQTGTRTIIDAKMSLSLWLRAGRAQKGLSLDDVARITKIQPRILERLEAGKLEGLPAEVFVRGFVRSYARCVGLDEAEALERYALAATATQATAAAGASPTPAARALVDSMSELAPITARSPKVLRQQPELVEQLAAGSLPELPAAKTEETVVEVFLPETGTLVAEPEPVVVEAAIVEAAPVAQSASDVVVEPAKKQSSKKRRGKGRNKKKAMAEGTPSQPMPVVAPPAEIEPLVAATPVDAAEPVVDEVVAAEPVVEDVAVAVEASSEAPSETDTTAEPEMSEPWSPKMPTVVAPTVPWRRPSSAMTSTAPAAVVPSLVIDDADPESAERELEDRIAAKEPARRSFLPPILLDREDRSARQGGLTLAVIILLIAATLTLSYLMRRPSSTGDGVTELDTASQIHNLA